MIRRQYKVFNPTNLRINVNTIKSNLEAVQKAIGGDVEIVPVVKGHAYGVGFEAIAPAIANSKIASVATLAEAIKLKDFFSGEILLLYQPCMEDIPFICEHAFQVGVSNNFEFIEELNRQAYKPVKVHINVETGSGMLGVQVPDLKEFCGKIKLLDNIKVTGIFMHYSCTESLEPDDIEFSNMQSELFEKAIEIAENELGEIPYKHAGCSSATFSQPQSRYNMVRVGMLLYGYYPAAWLKEYVKVKPALKFTAKIIQIAEYPPDYCIGYSRMFKTKGNTRIATVSGGYADGILRSLFKKGEVVVNGQRAPLVGRICMDMAMVDITGIKGEVRYNDEIAFWDNEVITIHEFARNASTNVAECMVCIGQGLNCIIDDAV